MNSVDSHIPVTKNKENKNGMFIDHNLFVEILALCGLDTNYSDPELSNL